MPFSSSQTTWLQGIAQPPPYDFPDAPFISLGEDMRGSGWESDWLIDVSGLHSNALFEGVQLTSLANANTRVASRRPVYVTLVTSV